MGGFERYCLEHFYKGKERRKKLWLGIYNGSCVVCFHLNSQSEPSSKMKTRRRKNKNKREIVSIQPRICNQWTITNGISSHLISPQTLHTGAKSHFLSKNCLEFQIWKNLLKLRFWKCDFEDVIFAPVCSSDTMHHSKNLILPSWWCYEEALIYLTN